MNSKTSPPVAPGPLAAQLHNATIDKAESSDFSNTAGDTIKITVNNYNLANEESSDTITFFRNVVQPFVAEVRKNDHSRSTVAESTGGSDPIHQPVTTDHIQEGDPVNIVNLVPTEPSSLPIANVADLYTRSMLKCLAGYPLYDPKPLSEHTKEYLRHGVNVGDVGFVRGDGTFDFLFNICPSKNGLINPPNLSNGFILETVDHSATRDQEPLPRNTRLFQSPVTKTRSGEYICEGPEGAVLELPEGAIRDEAMNIRHFANLAVHHGVQWYKYTMRRGRDISNGSLYLITSCTKCTQWGIAVFDRRCAQGQGLKFDKKRSLPFGKSTSKYHWKGSDACPTKVSNLNQGDAPNQCVFLRGYKIMIRQDIFDNLCNDQPRGSEPAIPSSSGSTTMTRQPATRIRGGGGTDPMSKRLTTMLSTTKSAEVVLHPCFNSSLIHPSDLINAALLSQNPGAKVALTHDDVWCDILRDNFPQFDYPRLMTIARSYKSTIDEHGCVRLEKIFCTSNVLDESSQPLQGTESPGLQEPLTTQSTRTPDKDYIPVPAMISPDSLTLPHELVERVLLLLDTESMVTCRLVNKEFNEIIQSSTLLQYFLACKAAGVIDNTRSRLSYAERLKALEKREDAWRKLKPMFETTIKVDHQTSVLYRLTGGAYFLNDNNQKDLNYCHLPSSPQDNPRWIRIPGHGPGEGSLGILVTYAIAVYEHDLIVNFISSDVRNHAGIQQHSLDLVLLKLSTGEYHSLARHPRIHVQRLASAKPLVFTRIVGDNLAFVVHSRDGTFRDALFIFDWKTGHKRLQHETAGNGYSSLVFISPELLLVPNLLSRFEIWHLPASKLDPKPPVQILSFQLPAVSPDYSISELRCYGAPSPFLHSMPYFPPRPFFPSSENAIIVVNLYISSISPFLRRQRASYRLIMHRRALLDMIQKWTSLSLLEQQKDLPTWLANGITVHKIADPDGGSVKLDAQSKLVSIMPHPRTPPLTDGSPTSATSTTSHSLYVSTDSGSSSVSSGSPTALSTSRYDFLRVQWSDWGPPVSRWFQVSETQAGWMANSAGERYAFSVPNPRDQRKLMVSIADFNPHNVRKHTGMMTGLRELREDISGNDKIEKEEEEEEEEEELEMLNHEDMFSEEVYMGLKCVIYHAPDEYDFDVVLMDEERLLGLKLKARGIESIKVLYFG